MTLYNDSINSVQSIISQKLKDSNHRKSPRQKTVLVDRIHTSVFNGGIGAKFADEDGAGPYRYSLTRMDRVRDVFKDAALRVYDNANDICLVTPWVVLTEKFRDFNPGKLAIPISEGDDRVICFVPCGGFDDDTACVPTWCHELSLSTALGEFKWELYDQLKTIGRGLVTVEKNPQVPRVQGRLRGHETGCRIHRCQSGDTGPNEHSTHGWSEREVR